MKICTTLRCVPLRVNATHVSGALPFSGSSTYGLLRMLQPVLVGLTLVLAVLLVMQSVTSHPSTTPTINGAGAVKTTGTGGGAR